MDVDNFFNGNSEFQNFRVFLKESDLKSSDLNSLTTAEVLDRDDFYVSLQNPYSPLHE